MTDQDDGEEDKMSRRMKELYEEKKVSLNPSAVDIDRPGGLLTKTDRKYLIGQKEYQHQQSDAKRRQEIRKRVKHGFLDFSLILYFLENKEREKIFEAYDERTLIKVLGDLISFIFLGVGQDVDEFEQIIESGVYTGSNFDESGKWAGNVNNVEANIDMQEVPNTDQLYEKFITEERMRDNDLTPREIGLLVRDGKISEDELDTLVRRRLPPRGPISSPRSYTESGKTLIKKLRQKSDLESIQKLIERTEFANNPHMTKLKKEFSESDETNLEEFLDNNEIWD